MKQCFYKCAYVLSAVLMFLCVIEMYYLSNSNEKLAIYTLGIISIFLISIFKICEKKLNNPNSKS